MKVVLVVVVCHGQLLVLVVLVLMLVLLVALLVVLALLSALLALSRVVWSTHGSVLLSLELGRPQGALVQGIVAL